MPARPSLSLKQKLAPALLALGLVLASLPAHADDYGTVLRLQQRGETAEALAHANAYIADHPRDLQMRFLKANVLGSAGQTDEALQLLTELTRDYPELAEPWNNLAVLEAGRGQLEAARDALETALRIQPDYATALENLGDVQARMALRTYEQAHRADPDNPRLAPRIEALRSLWNGAAADN